MTLYDYLDKTCPYCKSKFAAFDDIVVCSKCDMPHHRECWVENQGCTTFGCQGTIKRADYSSNSVTATEITFEDAPAPIPAPSAVPVSAPVSTPAPVYAPTPVYTPTPAPSYSIPAEKVFCTQCGKENAVHHTFCYQCGARLVKPGAQAAAPAHVVHAAPVVSAAVPSATPIPYQAPAYNQAHAYTNHNYSAANQNYSAYSYSASLDPDVIRLIGTKEDYYTAKFQELKAQNKKTSWNWPAFLITPYWLVYRKMYGYGAACLGIAFLLSLFGGVFTLVSLAGYIAAGIYGNYIYLNYLEKNAQQAKNIMEPAKSQFMIQKGDVNMTAAILTAVGYGILVALLM